MHHSTLAESLQLLGSMNPERMRLEQILPLASYYPGAGFDGDPYRYYSSEWPCHVFVDYGVNRNQLLAMLNSPSALLGYGMIASRSLDREEVVPRGWRPPQVLGPEDKPERFLRSNAAPFCEWIVFERAANRDDSHGPRRIGMLYLCGDGVASFDGLYSARSLLPAAVFIKDHGFGGNWTSFSKPSGPFWKAVTNNGAGPMPKTLLVHGGSGEVSCWPEEYSESRPGLSRGEWNAFSRSDD